MTHGTAFPGLFNVQRVFCAVLFGLLAAFMPTAHTEEQPLSKERERDAQTLVNKARQMVRAHADYRGQTLSAEEECKPEGFSVPVLRAKAAPIIEFFDGQRWISEGQARQHPVPVRIILGSRQTVVVVDEGYVYACPRRARWLSNLQNATQSKPLGAALRRVLQEPPTK